MLIDTENTLRLKQKIQITETIVDIIHRLTRSVFNIG